MLFDGFFSGREQIVAFRPDHHAGRRLGGTGPDRRLFPFLHDQTHAARPERIERVVVAHGGNDLARAAK